MSDSPAPLRWAVVALKAAIVLLVASWALQASARLLREAVPMLVVLSVLAIGGSVVVARWRRRDRW